MYLSKYILFSCHINFYEDAFHCTIWNLVYVDNVSVTYMNMLGHPCLFSMKFTNILTIHLLFE